MVNKYPEDEFDRLAAERATRGAHRRTRNVRPWLLSLIAVLILAPLIGLGIGSLMSGRDTDPQAGETTATQTTDSGQPANDGEADTTGDGADGEGADGDGTNGDGTTGDADGDAVEGEETEDGDAATDAEANLDASILVLNGRGTVGFAGENRDVLAAAGFTNLAVADYAGGAEPAESTVYYASPELEATANAVAEELEATGIVESAPATDGYDIVVVAR